MTQNKLMVKQQTNGAQENKLSLPLGKSALQPGSAGSLVWKPSAIARQRQPGFFMPDDIRRMGIYILAGKGSGKSRIMGRAIAWGDFIRGVPQVIFDPMGQTIDNFLDKIVRLSEQEQRQLWPRVLYVDMSGEPGRVMPFPLYYRLGSESLNTIGSRFIEAIKRLDPDLKAAPMQGLNAIERVGKHLGIILAALGWQITEAQDILDDPEVFTGRLQALAANSQDIGLRKAVKFFTAVDPKQWRSADWKKQKESLETKIALFLADNATAAMFGADQPAIDWQKVLDKRLTVLLDFRHDQQNEDLLKFKMLWAFLYFLAFLKNRGAGRHEDYPIGLIVDELTTMYNFDSEQAGKLFAQDLDSLINIWARNANCWLTLAHQERFQVSEKARDTLMGMGTNIIGLTSSTKAALELAENLIPLDPLKVKRYENVWMSDPLFGPYVVEKKPVEYSLEEQKYLNAYKFRHLRKFLFWVKAAQEEGSIAGQLRLLQIDKLDAGIWPAEAAVVKARRQLVARDGLKVKTVLDQIKARPLQDVAKSDTLNSDDKHPDLPDPPTGETDTDWRDDLAG